MALFRAEGGSVVVDLLTLRVTRPSGLSLPPAVGRCLRDNQTAMIEAWAQVREGLGFSQLELSRRCGIAQESLSRIETGRRDPRLNTLQRLARGMGLSLDELLGRLSAAP